MYIVINGGGKVGEYLATVLLQSGNEVAVIERDTSVADRLSMVLQGRYLVIRGDGCDSRYQEDAGIRKADVFVAATGVTGAQLREDLVDHELGDVVDRSEVRIERRAADAAPRADRGDRHALTAAKQLSERLHDAAARARWARILGSLRRRAGGVRFERSHRPIMTDEFRDRCSESRVV